MVTQVSKICQKGSFLHIRPPTLPIESSILTKMDMVETALSTISADISALSLSYPIPILPF